MKPLFVSATVQDSGKTTLVCGLLQVLRARQYDAGYFKPVGQHYVEYEGKNIDEDAVLIREVFNLNDQSYHLSPIAIERGFTEKFILNPDIATLERKILSCSKILAQAHPVLIVEGTGHAGVGSCFGLSNARIAKLLGAEVILVTPGGIGRPIDEIALNLAMFRAQEVNVAGVILNKVIPEKLETIRSTVCKGLENLDTKLLGVLPYNQTLSLYTIGQIAEELNYTVLCGGQALSNRIEHTIVAAMEPQNVLRYIKNGTLIITPGDRIDNILVSMVLSKNKEFACGISIAGLILTGGLRPPHTIYSLLCKNNIPVLISDDDTFTVCSRMKQRQFKIQASDSDKIVITRNFVEKYINIDQIMDAINE